MTRRDLALFGWGATAACGPAPGSGITAKAFIANSQGASISVIDLSLMTVVKRVGLNANPIQVVGRHDAAEILALAEDGVLHIVDARTGAQTRSIAVAPQPKQMALVAAVPRLLVILAERELAFVNLRDYKVTKLALPAAAAGFDVSPETAVGVVNCAQRGELHLFDCERPKWLRVLRTPARQARFLKNGRQLLIGRRDDRLLAIVDTETGDTVVELPLALTPDRFCFSGDLGQLFVNGDGSDSLAVVYPFQTEVAATLLAGHRPGAMAASRNPAYLFVANPAAGSVTVVDVVTQRIIGAAPVGQEPSAIAITPDDQFALVLNRASGDVAVLKTEAFTKIVRRNRSAPMFLMVPVGSAPISAAFSYYRT